MDTITHALIFARLGFWSGLTLSVFNFHFIISSLRLLPVVICNFYQDLFIIASDRTDAVINHARQLGIVVHTVRKEEPLQSKKRGEEMNTEIIIFTILFNSKNTMP